MADLTDAADGREMRENGHQAAGVPAENFGQRERPQTQDFLMMSHQVPVMIQRAI